MAAPKIVLDEKSGTYEFRYRPFPRQKVLHETTAKQILFGGAAGGPQPLRAPVLTPDGWSEIGKLKLGDRLVDPALGGYSTVTHIHEVKAQPCFRMMLDLVTRRKVLSTLDHLFPVAMDGGEAPDTLDGMDLATTQEILDAMMAGRQPHLVAVKEGRIRLRKVLQVEGIGTRTVRCVTIDRGHGLYVTCGHVVTHNSKSTAIRWDAYTFCLQNPGLRAYLFRRKRPELQRNHIDFIRDEVPQELATYSAKKDCLEWHNGSLMYFGYCDSVDDLQNWQGMEAHWLGIDEATHFEPMWINYLRTRVRLGSFTPKVDAARLPRLVLATNPQSGPGHAMCKRVFVDPAPPETTFRDASTAIPEKRLPDGTTRPAYPGDTTIYIPSRMSDNPYLDENYAAKFAGLPPELIKALVDGDWDAVVGAALHNLSRERHMLPKIRTLDPKLKDPVDCTHWTHFTSMDWGNRTPFSVGWYCVADHGFDVRSSKTGKVMHVPEGAVIRFAEWYGCKDGEDNVGLGMTAEAVARGILDRERKWGLPPMDYRIADSQMWAATDGPSPQEHMYRHGVVLRQSKKDRAACYAEFISRLEGTPRQGGKGDHPPMFFVTENCRAFWDTVPPLVIDQNDPDKGWSKVMRQADHIADEVGYGLRSRPFVIDEAARSQQEYDSWREAYRRAREDAGSDVLDPYAT